MPVSVHFSTFGSRINERFFDDIKKNKAVYDSGTVGLTFKLKNFKGGGFFATGVIKRASGRLIIASDRFVAQAGEYKLLDVPLGHDAMKCLKFGQDKKNHFTVKADLTRFGGPLTGQMKLIYEVSAEDVPLKKTIRHR